MAIGLVVLLAASSLLSLVQTEANRINQAQAQQSAARLAYRRVQQVAIHAGQYKATQPTQGAVQLLRPRPELVKSDKPLLVLASAPHTSDSASDCLGRLGEIDGFLSSVFYVHNNSLRCNVADRSGGQPIENGFSALSLQWFVAGPQGIRVIKGNTPSALVPYNNIIGHAACLSQTDKDECVASPDHRAVAWAASGPWQP